MASHPVVERLSDVEARIGSVRQLSAVITAMRGIAAARSRKASARLEGVKTYAATLETAIGEALALLPERGASHPGDGLGEQGGQGQQGHQEAPPGRHHLVIALAAEQGFAGAFNTRILDAAERRIGKGGDGHAELLLVGDRGVMAAAERGLAFASSLPMAAHVDQAATLASRIADLLFQRAGEGRLTRVTVLHAMPGVEPETGPGEAILEKTLLPFDYTRIPAAARGAEPLITLPAEVLLARLTEEYVFAEMCEALLLSHAAENEARMRAMVAAHDNVERKLDELGARARLLRQEQITDELIELTAGTRASASGRHAGVR